MQLKLPFTKENITDAVSHLMASMILASKNLFFAAILWLKTHNNQQTNATFQTKRHFACTTFQTKLTKPCILKLLKLPAPYHRPILCDQQSLGQEKKKPVYTHSSTNSRGEWKIVSFPMGIYLKKHGKLDELQNQTVKNHSSRQTSANTSLLNFKKRVFRFMLV